MNIHIFCDEAGTFDKVHNDFFVFAGVICLGTEAKASWIKEYRKAERVIPMKRKQSREMKAVNLHWTKKWRLIQSMDNCHKFCGVLSLKEISDFVFGVKSNKQRYLDTMLITTVKKALEKLVMNNIIQAEDVERLFINFDDHPVATDWYVELKRALKIEFLKGEYDLAKGINLPVLFPKIKDVQLEFCDSKETPLVRAADIVANLSLRWVTSREVSNFEEVPNLFWEYVQ